MKKTDREIAARQYARAVDEEAKAQAAYDRERQRYSEVGMRMGAANLRLLRAQERAREALKALKALRVLHAAVGRMEAGKYISGSICV